MIKKHRPLIRDRACQKIYMNLRIKIQACGMNRDFKSTLKSLQNVFTSHKRGECFDVLLLFKLTQNKKFKKVWQPTEIFTDSNGCKSLENQM